MAFSIYDGLDVLSGPPSFWTADCKRVHPNVALDVGALVICISCDIWLGHMVMFVFFFLVRTWFCLLVSLLWLVDG